MAQAESADLPYNPVSWHNNYRNRYLFDFKYYHHFLCAGNVFRRWNPSEL